MPGALALLAQRLLPLAVVTSATRQVAVGRLLRADLPVPAILVSCDDVEQGKPDPEPYLLAAARLGVDAVACVGIEDTPAGLMDLRAAGCAALAVLTTHSADELGDAHVLVPDLTAIQIGASSVSWQTT